LQHKKIHSKKIARSISEVGTGLPSNLVVALVKAQFKPQIDALKHKMLIKPAVSSALPYFCQLSLAIDI
jgi:HD-like signal output (HDOD) protein